MEKQKAAGRLEGDGRRQHKGRAMTGDELKRIQHKRGASDSEFLIYLGRKVNATTLRRLRAWKAGKVALPPDVVDAALRLVDGHA